MQVTSAFMNIAKPVVLPKPSNEIAFAGNENPTGGGGSGNNSKGGRRKTSLSVITFAGDDGKGSDTRGAGTRRKN